MSTIDFKDMDASHRLALKAALEVATAHASLSSYKISQGSIEVDPETQKELTAEEKELLDKFEEDARNQIDWAIHTREANESVSEILSEVTIRDASAVAASTARRVASAVKVYSASNDKMLATLMACRAQLAKKNPKDSINVAFDFGAYSRFFHIGGIACNTPNDFINGIYVHRNTSDWAMRHGFDAISDVYKQSENAFASMHRKIHEMSVAIADNTFDRAMEQVFAAYSEPLRQPIALRGMSTAKLEVPRKFRNIKDHQYTPKGHLFDSSVLCTVQVKKGNMQYRSGAAVLQDADAPRSRTTGWDISDLRTLIAIVDHGIEIAQNTKAYLDMFSDFGDDYLKPISEALLAVVRLVKFRDESDVQTLLSQVKIAQLICNCAINPLLYVLWLDIRLTRCIAGVAEAYFVKDPKKRISLKKEVEKV